MAQHTQFSIDTGVALYFCDPQVIWQRGSNGKHQRAPPSIISPKAPPTWASSLERTSTTQHTPSTAGRDRPSTGWHHQKNSPVFHACQRTLRSSCRLSASGTGGGDC